MARKPGRRQVGASLPSSGARGPSAAALDRRPASSPFRARPETRPAGLLDSAVAKHRDAGSVRANWFRTSDKPQNATSPFSAIWGVVTRIETDPQRSQPYRPVTDRSRTTLVCQARSSDSARCTRAPTRPLAHLECGLADDRRESICTGRRYSPRGPGDGNLPPSSIGAGPAA